MSSDDGQALEQKSIGCPSVEQSRKLRIEADAVRTRVAVAAFALLDMWREAVQTIEESFEISSEGIGAEEQDAILQATLLPAVVSAEKTSRWAEPGLPTGIVACDEASLNQLVCSQTER